MIMKESLIEFLTEHQIKFRDSGNKVQHLCLSPSHLEDNPSAYTDFSKEGEAYSHCSSCGFHLDIEGLAKLLGKELDIGQLFLSFINRTLSENSDEVYESNKIYLPIKTESFNKDYRGIKGETFERVGAYITDPDSYYGKRIIFPIRNVKGDVVNFEAVSTNKKRTPKVLRPKNVDTSRYFGFENLIEGKLVFICEGLFSALSFIELGYNGIFNFGVASIEGKLQGLLQKGVTHIVLAGDNDEAGRKFNGECYKILRGLFQVTFFKHHWLAEEKSDSNDYLRNEQFPLQSAIDKTLSGFYVK